MMIFEVRLWKVFLTCFWNVAIATWGGLLAWQAAITIANTTIRWLATMALEPSAPNRTGTALAVCRLQNLKKRGWWKCCEQSNVTTMLIATTVNALRIRADKYPRLSPLSVCATVCHVHTQLLHRYLMRKQDSFFSFVRKISEKFTGLLFFLCVIFSWI